MVYRKYNLREEDHPSSLIPGPGVGVTDRSLFWGWGSECLIYVKKISKCASKYQEYHLNQRYGMFVKKNCDG